MRGSHRCFGSYCRNQCSCKEYGRDLRSDGYADARKSGNEVYGNFTGSFRISIGCATLCPRRSSKLLLDFDESDSRREFRNRSDANHGLLDLFFVAFDENLRATLGTGKKSCLYRVSSFDVPFSSLRALSRLFGPIASGNRVSSRSFVCAGSWKFTRGNKNR